MSSMPAALRRRLLFDAPIKRHTAKTITDPYQLEQELKHIRKDRLATDDGGFLDGLISVAVPVLEKDGSVFAAVAVHAPSARLSLRKALTYTPLLRRAGCELAELCNPTRPPSC
jgi:IclR family transcriptional regulator, acetate operon repressor